jgi:CheY-like chemotaxis protein
MMKMPKILVAEDDPSLAQYYVILLSHWNCETVVEHTGKDAIHRAATFRPAIALLGVVMSEMGGIEAGIKLLEICPGTKIVLVTESVPPETLKQLEAQGYYCETLPAPSSREELHEAVFGQSCAKPTSPSTFPLSLPLPGRPNFSSNKQWLCLWFL